MDSMTDVINAMMREIMAGFLEGKSPDLRAENELELGSHNTVLHPER